MNAWCVCLFVVVAATEDSCGEGASCVHKCCPPGKAWLRSKKDCVAEVTAFVAPLELEDGSSGNVTEAQLQGPPWGLTLGRQTCPEGKPIRARASGVGTDIKLLRDGKLRFKRPHTVIRYSYFTSDLYCLDTFLTPRQDGGNDAMLDAFVCFEEEPEMNNIIPMTGMLISCVFILLTMCVYATVPELRNMHGRVLMAYLASLFVGFFFLAILQLHGSLNLEKRHICLPFTFVIYLFLLAAFFWLNVMCFDIWWTFSGFSSTVASRGVFDRRRYVLYCVYAFGSPAVLTALLAIMEFVEGFPDYIVTPKLRASCFLVGDERLLYLYCPILILCIANGAFFVATSVNIARVRSQTAVLDSADSAKHRQYRKDKQRFGLYAKLFAVMGVNWVLEVMSALLPRVPLVWNVTDVYNVLVGLIIFLIFVCKKNTYRLVKKRYHVLCGAGAAPSRRASSSTRNTSSGASRDDVRMLSVHAPPAPA